MVLIEGLGDEVTLVLGSFLLIVILLLAWLSTHTDDIPLIREVGVIVVELRQRHRNRQQTRVDQQAPQEVEIPQTSREGLLNSSDTASVDDSEPGATNNDPIQDLSPSLEASDTALSSSSSVFTTPSTDHHAARQEAERNEVAAEGNAEARERRRTSLTTLIPVIPADPQLPVSGLHMTRELASSLAPYLPPAAQDAPGNPPSSQSSFLSTPINSRRPLPQEIDEETLRRRRVEYFRSGRVMEDIRTRGGSNINSGVGNSDNVSADDRNRGAQMFGGVQSRISNIGDNDSVRRSVQAGGTRNCDNNSSSGQQRTEPELSVPSQSESGGVERLRDRPPTTAAGPLDDVGGAQSTGPQSSSNSQSDNNVNIGDSLQTGTSDNGGFLEGVRIRVKLKYMNETQRFVYASPDDTIGDFRRMHFQAELRDNKWVRFIFNGQDLRDDTRTLQACNIEDNCTMHCLVTTRIQPGERQGEVFVEDDEESLFGTMMYPLFTVMLMIVWYFRIFYRQYFSAMSTVCLIGITFLLGLSYASSIRNVNAAATAANGQQQEQQSPQSPASDHPHSD